MNQKGFNLIEVVVSIAIITIGLLAVISLFGVNIKNGIKSKNKLIAIYLANESIEIIRQQRDNIWFKGMDWMTDIPIGDVAVVAQDNVAYDIRTGWDVVVALAGTDERKVFLTGNDVYLNDAATAPGAVDTGFERYLEITLGDGDDTNAVAVGCFDSTECMEITSHVSFNGVQLIEVTTYLYDKWF